MFDRLRRGFAAALIICGLAAPAFASPGAVSANRMRTPVVYDTSIGAGVDINGFASLPLRSGASRYYINSSTGSDANTCLQATSAATPKATLSSGIGCITAGNGDQALVAEGTTYSAGLPSLDSKRGFSAVYPTVIQTYDPADPTNEAKFGRGDQRNARPVINTGANAQTLTCCYDPTPVNYVAIRGFDINPGNVSDMTMSILKSGSPGVPSNSWLIENNLFRYTSLSINMTSGGGPRASIIVIRNNAFSGTWSAASHAQGVFISGTAGLTIEDNVFYHIGWKIGATRDDTTANGGPTVFRHAIYQQEDTTGTIRRNLMMEGSATGCSCRGDAQIYDNLFIDNPLSIIGGKGDNYNTLRPTGVDLAIRDNAVLGSVNINTSNPRGIGFTTGNGRSGSYFRNNLLARSNNVGGTNVYGFSIESEYAQPSYIAIEDNLEYSWTDSTHVFRNSGAFPVQDFPTYDRNAWTAAASGTNVNISSRIQAFAYTDDQLYTALGFTGANAAARRQAFIDYATDHPEAHIQRRGRSLLMAGYNVRRMAPPAAPTLGALTLSSTSYTRGTSASGTITSATPFSIFTTSGLPAGLTVDSMLRTWAWDGSGSGAASGSFSLIETLAGATGSPKTTSISYSITAPVATVWDTVASNATWAFTNTDHDATHNTAASHDIVRATVSHSGTGDWWFDVTVNSGSSHYIGLVNASKSLSGTDVGFDTGQSVSWWNFNYLTYNGGAQTNLGTGYASGDVVRIRLKNNKLYFGKVVGGTPTWVMGDPVAQTGGFDVSSYGALYPAASTGQTGDKFSADFTNW